MCWCSRFLLLIPERYCGGFAGTQGGIESGTKLFGIGSGLHQLRRNLPSIGWDGLNMSNEGLLRRRCVTGFLDMFSFFTIDSRPLSKYFRSNWTVFYILHNRFRFPDRAFPFPFPFPNKNMKTKMVRVFSRPIPTAFIPSDKVCTRLLAMCI